MKLGSTLCILRKKPEIGFFYVVFWKNIFLNYDDSFLRTDLLCATEISISGFSWPVYCSFLKMCSLVF